MAVTLVPVGRGSFQGMPHTTHIQADQVGCWFYVKKQHNRGRTEATLRRWLSRWASRQGITPLWGTERFVFKTVDPNDPWPGWPNDGVVVGSVGLKMYFRLEKEWLIKPT